jgi:hypothetical protein
MSSQQSRLIASASLTPSAISVFGRSYTGTPGTIKDVPLGDADVLGTAGWMRLPGMSGPTSGRPTPRDADTYAATPGELYLDTSLGLVIMFDGAVWRNPVTGAAV